MERSIFKKRQKERRPQIFAGADSRFFSSDYRPIIDNQSLSSMRANDLPQPDDYQTYESFDLAANRWEEEIESTFQDVILPLPVWSVIKRHPIGPSIQNEHFPCELAPAQPIPSMYKTYEEFLASMKNWSAINATNMAHPSKIISCSFATRNSDSYRTFAPKVSSKPLISAFSAISPPKGRKLLLMQDLLSALFDSISCPREADIEASAVPQNLILYGPNKYSDAQQIQAEYTHQKIRLSLTHKSLYSLLSAPPPSNIDMRLAILDYIVSEIRGNTSVLNQITQSPHHLYNLTLIAATNQALEVFDPCLNTFSIDYFPEGVEKQRFASIISHVYSSIAAYYLLSTFVGVVGPKIKEPSPMKQLSLRSSAAKEQADILLSEFGSDLAKWMEGSKKGEKNVFFILRVLLSSSFSLPPFSKGVVHFIGTLSLNSYSKIYMDSFRSKRIRALLLSAIVDLRCTSAFSFCNMLMETNVTSIEVPSVTLCDWAKNFIVHLNNINSEKSLSLAKCVCEFTYRCWKDGLIDKEKWNLDLPSLQILFESEVSHNYSGKFLAIKLRILSSLLKQPSPSQFFDGLQKSLGFIIALMAHNDIEIAKAADKLFRVLAVYQTQSFFTLMRNPSLRSDLVAALSCASLLLSIEMVGTLAKFMETHVPTEEREIGVNIAPNLVYFSEFVSILREAGFNPFSWIVLAKKYPSRLVLYSINVGIISRFEKAISTRPNCKFLLRPQGKIKRSLSTNTKLGIALGLLGI